MLVTGAGTGIGAAIAVAFAKAGARVSLAGRRAEPLMAVAASLVGAEIHPIPGFDVTEPARIAALVPMKRAGRPEEVADLVGFLVSPQAGYITGQTISINGGMA